MTLEERLEGIVAGTQKKEAVEAILSWVNERMPKEKEEMDYDRDHASWGNADDSFNVGFDVGREDGYNEYHHPLINNLGEEK